MARAVTVGIADRNIIGVDRVAISIGKVRQIQQIAGCEGSIAIVGRESKTDDRVIAATVGHNNRIRETIAGAYIDSVISCAAFEPISTRATAQPIIARTADQCVIASVCRNKVVARTSIDSIIPTTANDCIVTTVAENQIIIVGDLRAVGIRKPKLHDFASIGSIHGIWCGERNLRNRGSFKATRHIGVEPEKPQIRQDVPDFHFTVTAKGGGIKCSLRELIPGIDQLHTARDRGAVISYQNDLNRSGRTHTRV